jgi:uncharacterized protein involved in type VI secretion and phage assembly
MSALGDLLQPSEDRGARIHGVVTAIVTNNQDPDKLARIKVKFPWLSGNDESWWARLAVPMAGKDAGTYFLPEVDDEVLVAFEHGDVRFPYVLGALWHSGDKAAPPPEGNGNGKNERSVLRSRAGLTITLDDTNGKERIVIADKDGKATVTVDAAKTSIVVAADKDVTVRSESGAVTVEAATESIIIAGSKDVTIRAKGGAVTIEGASVAVKASSGKLALEGVDVEIKSKANLKLQATGIVEVNGAMIKLG